MAEDDEQVDAGSDSAEWPEFEVPAGVGEGDNEDSESLAVTADRQPDADAEPQPDHGAQTPPEAPPAGEPPPYRFSEVISQRDQYRSQLEAANRELAIARSMLSQGRPPQDAPPPGPPEDPTTKAVRERLLQVMPELKDALELAKNTPQLLETAKRGQEWARAEKSYWDRYAQTTLSSVFTHAAKELLGAGPDGKEAAAQDLSPMARESIRDSFIRWVVNDPERAERYKAQDGKLAGEFWTLYRAAVIAPARRQASTTVLSRAQQAARTPQSGGPSAPVTSPQTSLNTTDEDAIHKAAWAKVREVQNAR